jgi:hypothetical protein
MKYRLSSPQEAGEAFQLLSRLVGDGKMVEIKEIKPKRSLPQNAYLHSLLGIFGSHFGYTLEEAKLLWKRDMNPSIFVYEKEHRGKNFTFIRSSADLTRAEMVTAIDTLKEWSKKGGFTLPDAEDEDKLRYYENQAEASQHYLQGGK